MKNFFRLLMIVAGFCASPGLSAQTADAPALTGIAFSEVGGRQVQIDFITSAPPPDAQVFYLSGGRQLVIDMPGLVNQTDKQYYTAQIEQLDNLIVVADEERVRVVLNLYNPSEYVIQRGPTGYIMLVGPDSNLTANPVPAAPPAGADPVSRVTSDFGISGIDFRRTAEGGGRVLVHLTHPGISANLFRMDNRVIAEMPRTELPDALEQRLDVTAFATPVLTIDSSRAGTAVRLVITATGAYRYNSVQIDDTLHININPISQAEQVREEQSAYTGELIKELDFDDVPVRQVLTTIADFTEDNLVLSDSVDGRMTLRVRDVRWDNVFDLVLQRHGLTHRRHDNILFIAPIEEVLASEREALAAAQEISDIEPLVTELIEIKYAEAADIAGSLRGGGGEEETNSLLSDRGSVAVDERTNSLLVRETPSHLVRMRNLIEQFDRPVRQVQIDTRIIEAQGDFSKNLGARLGLTFLQRLGGDQVVVEQPVFDEQGNQIGTVETPNFLDRLGSVQGFGSGSIENTNRVRSENATETSDDALSVNLPAGAIGDSPAAQYGLTLGTISSNFIGLLDLEISALQSEAQGRVLANPRVLTTNNNEAVIQRGQERTLTIQGGTGTGGGTETVEAELSLRVTPQITPDDSIILDVEITNDAFQPSPVGEAIKSTQQITTQALLKNGETVVIGGVFYEGEQTGQVKVPLLGDIPYLGRLFRRDTRTSERNELLVFLTPRIVEGPLF